MFKKPITFCCNKDIKPIYEYVDEYDYFNPIKKFSREYNINFKVDDSKDYIKQKKILPQTKENDDVINHYIKSSKDISIILVYPTALKYPKMVDKILDELKINGNIYYIKKIPFNFIMTYNLIYQLYYDEKRMKHLRDINYKCNRVGFDYDSKTTKDIMIIVYHHKNKKMPISGNSSEFKNYLRNFFLQEDIKITKYQPDDDKYPRLYDYIHIGNNDSQSYTYSGIFFNSNSIRFLNKQYSWKIYNWKRSINKFNILKDLLYNYSQKEVESLMVISSGVLFSHGIREMNDIDALMIKSTIEPKVIEAINKDKIIDISYPGTSEYNKDWENVLNERAISFGAKNYIELIVDPKYHYYFMGIKFLRLKYEVMTRLKRNRPAQITDLIVMRQMYDFSYKLSIPKTKTMFDKKKNKDVTTEVNEKTVLSTIKWYLETRYFIYLTTEQIKDWILNYGSQNKDNMLGGKYILPIKYASIIKDVSDDKYIFSTKDNILKMGYIPNVIIYGDNYPFLYPSEQFNIDKRYCSENNFKNKEIKVRKSLSVMTFNVHNFVSRCNMGNTNFRPSFNPYKKSRDIKEFIKFFKKYSPTVICLQEVAPVLNKSINENITDYEFIREKFNFNYLNKLMHEIGYKYKVIGNSKNGNRMKKEEPNYFFLANAVYSKVPIVEHKIIQFDFIDRNFIDIIIEYNGKKINIINLHFEYFNDESLKFPEIKDVVLKQFEIISEYLKIIKNRNIIICGDFNINLFEKILFNKRYLQNYQKKVDLITKNFKNTSKINIPTNFTQKTVTDYILVSKISKVKTLFTRVIKNSLSDHYPVLAYFK